MISNIKVYSYYWRAKINKALSLLKNADCFQLLEVFQFMGASSNKPPRGFWIMIWIVMHALSLWSYSLVILNAIQTFSNDYSFSASVWYVSLAGGMTSVLLQVLVMWYHAESIRQVHQFVDSKFAASGDSKHDEVLRETFARNARFGVVAMIISILADEIMFLVPNSQRDRLYPFPLDGYLDVGSSLGRFARDTFQYSIPLIWISKYLWPSTKLLTILKGLQVELKIMAHRIENDLRRMQSEISGKHFYSKKQSLRRRAREAFWKQLTNDFGKTLEQHLELIRNIELLQPSISKVFFVFYSFGIIGFGAISFVIMDERLSFISLVLGISVCTSFLLGYCWCQLVDSFQDVNDLINGTVYEMIVNLPYDEENRSSYRPMRTSLMIVTIYTANAGKISSGGTVDITMTTFAKVMDTSYSMLKFLLSMH